MVGGTFNQVMRIDKTVVEKRFLPISDVKELARRLGVALEAPTLIWLPDGHHILGTLTGRGLEADLDESVANGAVVLDTEYLLVASSQVEGSYDIGFELQSLEPIVENADTEIEDRNADARQLKMTIPFEEPIVEAPTLRRDELRTLADWEQWLKWNLRQVELIGEIPISKRETLGLGKLIGSSVKGLATHRRAHHLAMGTPATLATYLVAEGIYFYDQGDFWTSVEEHIGVEVPSTELGQVFEATIETFNLPRFLGMGGHRYVAVILAHGGIPDYCLPDFFEKVLLPAATRAEFSELETTELIDRVLDRSEVRIFADKPVQRFLEHGGKVSEDFVGRCLELVNIFVDTGEVASRYEVGLPERVVECFRDWLEGRETDGQSPIQREKRDVLRLVAPRLRIDPWGEGVFIQFPAQLIPASMSDSHFGWRARTLAQGMEEREIPVRVRTIGLESRTEALGIPVEQVPNHVDVSFVINGQTRRSWRSTVARDELPLIAFDPLSQELLKWRGSLPARQLWLLVGKECKLSFSGEAALIEQLPELPGEWHNFNAQDWDLSGTKSIQLVRTDGRSWTLPIEKDESTSSITLDKSSRIDLDSDPEGRVTYVGQAPSMIILPSGGRTPEEEAGRWTLTLDAVGAGSDHKRIVAKVAELGSATSLQHDSLVIDLGAPSLLGEEVAGCFNARLRGPLGRDATFAIKILPPFELRGIPDLLAPELDKKGYEFTLSTAPDVTVESAGEGTSVLRRTMSEYDVSLSREAATADLLFSSAESSDRAVSVSANLVLPRLAWSILESRQGLAGHLWTDNVVKRSIDELDRSAVPIALDIKFPRGFDNGGQVAFRLSDAEQHVLMETDTTPLQPGRRYVRQPLGPLVETIRSHPSTAYKIELLATKHTDWLRFHVLTVTQALRIEDVELSRPRNGQDGWSIVWKEERAIPNRMVSMASSWRPWQPPLTLLIPDDCQGELTFVPPKEVELSGQVHTVFFIRDPWVTSDFGFDEAAGGGFAEFDVGLDQPSRRLAELERATQSFFTHFEAACICTTLSQDEGGKSHVKECMKLINTAAVEDVLALADWLEANGDHANANRLQGILFNSGQLVRLVNELKQGKVGLDVVQAFLERAPDSDLINEETASLLTAMPFRSARLLGAKALLRLGQQRVLDRILAWVEEGEMTSHDAASLLVGVGDPVTERLRALDSDTVATLVADAMDQLLPGSVPLVTEGKWVRTDAGWGKVLTIARSADGEAILTTLYGRTATKIALDLRWGEDPERVIIDTSAGQLDFADVEKVWTCSKCHRFSSARQSHVTGAHDRAVHGGIGPSLSPSPAKAFDVGEVCVSRKKPWSVWE